MNAYDEGQTDFHIGKGPEENPYPISDPDHYKWESGYQDADFQESGEYE